MALGVAVLALAWGREAVAVGTGSGEVVLLELVGGE